MAFATTDRSPARHSASRSLFATLMASFEALSRAIVAARLAEPRVAALRRLSETTDADLAARGTTRETEVRRIIGSLL